ncbi:MAG: excisionase family protein, partial [Cyanobacteriota bacterium]
AGAPSTAGEWVDARSLGKVLGVSEKTLCRWRKAGLFKPGVHWRRKFPTSNSPVLYHLHRCDAAMSESVARTPHLLEND